MWLILALALTDPTPQPYVPDLKVGGLLSTIGDFQLDPPDEENGFSIGDARLNLKGTLPDSKFSVFIQGNLVKTPALLDLRISWSRKPAFGVDLGFMKVPFSGEFLIGAANIDFTNRAQVVGALAPNRQVGIQLRGDPLHKKVKWSLGVFNGNRGIGGNDDEQFLFAGRITTETKLSNGRWELGINAAWSKDTSVRTPLGADFQGTRLLAGGDTRLEISGWFLSAEAIWGNFEPEGGDSEDVFGYQVSSGYYFTEKCYAQARWDSFSPPGDADRRDLALVGMGYIPNPIILFYLDYVIPVGEDVGLHRLLLTAQAAW